MKTLKLFLTLCLVASFSFAFAQSFGVKAGTNFSLAYGTPEELNGEAIESVKGGIGFQIGALAKFELADAVGLQVELLYETRKSTKTIDFGFQQPNPLDPNGTPLDVLVNGESSNTYGLINLPVLFTFGGEKLNFYVGPNVAYMVSGKSAIASQQAVSLGGVPLPDFSSEESLEIDQFNDDECGPCFEALEIGAQAGVVYNVSEGLGIDLRLGHSLTDFTNDDEDTSLLSDEKRDDNDRHFYVQLGVQFKF